MATHLQSSGSPDLQGATDVLLTPGYLLSEALAGIYPAITAGADTPPASLVTGLAAVFWLVAILVAAALLRRAFRIAVMIGFDLRRRVENTANGLRIWLIVRAKRLDWRRGRPLSIHEEIELDELDLAVLDHGATLAPGFAISVIDLSEALGKRPSRIENSLDKLRRHRLVDPLMGSSDGYGNYQLTESGAWYIAAHRRNEPAQAATR